MAARSHASQVQALAAELGECRQRGLDRLDVDTPPQSPVTAPVLEQLARDYCTRVAPQVHGRVAAIKHLLHDALATYSHAGNQADAALIAELLFPDPALSPAPGPGQMLKAAMQQRGVTDEKKFRDDRRRIFAAFAEYLTTYTHQTAVPARHRHRRVLTITSASSVVILAASVILWLSIRQKPQSPDSPSNTPSSNLITTTTNPPPPPGSTHPETVNAGVGARTYRNPAKLTEEGPRIDNRRTIQVSCKIAAPSAPSVGTYWYRIADPPWNNQYYSPANSYLNGDPPTGPYTHDIDPAVPDCKP